MYICIKIPSIYGMREFPIWLIDVQRWRRRRRRQLTKWQKKKKQARDGHI